MTRVAAALGLVLTSAMGSASPVLALDLEPTVVAVVDADADGRDDVVIVDEVLSMLRGADGSAMWMTDVSVGTYATTTPIDEDPVCAVDANTADLINEHTNVGYFPSVPYVTAVDLASDGTAELIVIDAFDVPVITRPHALEMHRYLQRIRVLDAATGRRIWQVWIPASDLYRTWPGCYDCTFDETAEDIIVSLTTTPDRDLDGVMEVFVATMTMRTHAETDRATKTITARTFSGADGNWLGEVSDTAEGAADYTMYTWRVQQTIACAMPLPAADARGEILTVTYGNDERLTMRSWSGGAPIGEASLPLTTVEAARVAAPRAAAGPAIVNSRDGVRAVDLTTGAVRWSADRGSQMFSLRDIDGDAVDDVMLRSMGSVRALSGSDGRVLWQRALWWAADVCCEPADLDGDGLFDPVIGGFSQSVRTGVLAGDSGQLLWAAGTWYTRAPGADLDASGTDDLVEVIDKADGVEVLARSGTDGSVLWTARVRVGAPGGLYELLGGNLDGAGADELIVQLQSRIYAVGPSGVIWSA